MKKRLAGHKSAQCYVIENEGRIDFISYRTRVITILHRGTDTEQIECTGTYSATTRKQIGWFLKEYMPHLSYHDMKAIAGKGMLLT